MAYIYKITNDINGKVYIGKTLYSIEKRWKEHISDSKKERCEKRPLYDAMNKYGVDKFSIECIEECSPEQSATAEEYWISKYRSYIGFSDYNGYNTTLGGDSKHYADYNWILELWNQGYNNKDIHNITGYDAKTIKTALENNGITEQERYRRGQNKNTKPVYMLDKDTLEVLKVFNCIKDAEIFLDKPKSSWHISEVAQGKRKTAYGYKWKFVNE